MSTRPPSRPLSGSVPNADESDPARTASALAAAHAPDEIDAANLVDGAAPPDLVRASDDALAHDDALATTAPLLPRLLRQSAIVAIRLAVTAAKFLLALYTARFLSLADLGIYGLMAAGTIMAPALTSLGMMDYLTRAIVGQPTAQAILMMTTRTALTTALHLVIQPMAIVAAMHLLGVPPSLAIVGGLIFFLENVFSEAGDILIARKHVVFANVLMFLRHGLWPLIVIGLGFFVPQTRTLAMLMGLWLAALVATGVLLALFLASKGRWRYSRIDLSWLQHSLRAGLVFYVKDVSSTVSAFADRFIISAALGLELAGVYTLFWSIANVVHSLTVSSVLQTHIGEIISAGRTRSSSVFGTLERRLQKETIAWALALSAGAMTAMPIVLALLERPLVNTHLAVFWLLIAATLVRIAADGYGFALLALSRDRAIATIALAGALASAALNLALVPVYGLWGAATAFALTAAGTFVARLTIRRRALGPP